MKRTLACLMCVLLLAGCVNSLQPAYRDEDVIFDPSLLGQWIDGKATWNVTRAGVKGYRVVVADETGRTGTFIAHLFKIEKRVFVDLLPLPAELRDSAFYSDHFLAAHTFYQVVRTQPTPQFASLNGDWLKAHLRSNPDALRHELVGNGVVITASTRDLQSFLLRHAETKDAFNADAPWQRDEQVP